MPQAKRGMCHASVTVDSKDFVVVHEAPASDRPYGPVPQALGRPARLMTVTDMTVTSVSDVDLLSGGGNELFITGPEWQRAWPSSSCPNAGIAS